jgi:hypothetical protein
LKRGEWDSNPRVLSNMGLAIPRPTRLGDPRFKIIFLQGFINYLHTTPFLKNMPTLSFSKIILNLSVIYKILEKNKKIYKKASKSLII